MGRCAKVYIFALMAVMIIHLQGCSLPEVVIIDDPLSPEEHLNLGLAYEKNGEIGLAEREYRAALEQLPAAYVYLGNLFFKMDKLEEAESCYKKAAEADPDNADALNNLAWLYYTRRANLDEAEELAIKAVKLETSKSDTYLDTLQKIRESKKKGH